MDSSGARNDKEICSLCEAGRPSGYYGTFSGLPVDLEPISAIFASTSAVDSGSVGYVILICEASFI